MDVGIVFSQADSGTDPVAIRRWALDAEAAGFHHQLAYDHILGATPERLGPGPFGAFPNAHGRAYVGPGWQQAVTEAMEAGCDRLSVGFNRLAQPGRSHAEHLDAIIAARPELDALIGRQ
jgi:hypothetical protein